MALFLLMIPLATAEITGFINDYAGILSDADKQQIEPILKGLYDQDLAEFAVVTVPNLEGRDIEGYAWELAEGKLGKKDKNNGLLLLVAVEDRQYRFEVGRGLEPVLPDGKIGRIGRNYLVENFRAGNYGEGIKEAVLAVQAVITEDNASEYYVQETPPVNKYAAIAVLIFFLMFIIIMISAIKHAKKHGRSDADFFFAAWLAGNMLRGKGGGFGGGFGGFGGGSFGGGGAGGGW